jgi:hypothetical protein
MHYVIDIIAALLLLFFFLAGWHKGIILSLLGVVRVVIAYGAAYFAGRYVGLWLGEAVHRPRIITVPIAAIMTFFLITFIFHLIMSGIRARHLKKVEEEEGYRHGLLSSLGGSVINLTAGLVSLMLLFWLGDLFMVGATGTAFPGSAKSVFSRGARRMIYETARYVIPEQDNRSQVNAVARMISTPADALTTLEEVVAADSIQQLARDETLAADLLSGDADRIRQNASLQRLFNDRATLEKLRELGVLSGHETRSGLCNKMAVIGQNEAIRTSIENLKAKELLRADKITLLVRDPDFDVIIAELLK